MKIYHTVIEFKGLLIKFFKGDISFWYFLELSTVPCSIKTSLTKICETPKLGFS